MATSYYTAGSEHDRRLHNSSITPSTRRFISVTSRPSRCGSRSELKLFGFHGLTVLLPSPGRRGAVWLVSHSCGAFRRGRGVLPPVPRAHAVSVASTVRATRERPRTVLLLAAWALTRAAEEGRRRFLHIRFVMLDDLSPVSGDWAPRWPGGRSRLGARARQAVDTALWKAVAAADRDGALRSPAGTDYLAARPRNSNRSHTRAGCDLSKDLSYRHRACTTTV